MEKKTPESIVPKVDKNSTPAEIKNAWAWCMPGCIDFGSKK